MNVSTSRFSFLLLVAVFVIATCGLIYELIAGTLASYLLGDSVTQFSTVIGCYLFAMGIGSWLSRYINRNLLLTFIQIEILVGLVGGFSAALLFTSFEFVSAFRVLLYFVVAVIGILVGIELPLLLRILKSHFDFKDLVSRVFTVDYIGALFASVLFPLLLVPHLGLVKSGFLFGILNTGVAMWLLYSLSETLPLLRLHRLAAGATLVVLTLGLAYSDSLLSVAEANAYGGEVIYATSSPYQRIALTREGNSLRLFLNGNLQFSSNDEYRYHEALVHPIMAALPGAKRVLVVGGGDGLAVREILKYPAVEHITMVDLDERMTDLFSSQPMLTQLNQDSLRSPKLTITHADAFVWLKEELAQASPVKFDAIFVDVPDPGNFSIGKLYSLTFFRLLKQVLADDGFVVVQSTSPFVARKSFWCVDHTLREAGLLTSPYHAYVPSFGDWGYIIGGKQLYQMPATLPANLRFLDQQTLRDMFHFPTDMGPVPTEVQRLDNQILVRYFEEEWAAYGVHY